MSIYEPLFDPCGECVLGAHQTEEQCPFYFFPKSTSSSASLFGAIE
jgi:hypothetical protein